MRNLFIISCTLLFFSCKKNGENNPAVTTDHAKLIFVSGRQYFNGAPTVTSLTAYNPDKTIKWKRNDLGTHQPSLPAGADGLLYLRAESHFHAINAETGTDAWKHPLSLSYYVEWLVDDGVLYASQMDGSVYFIRAFTASTGVMIWEKQTNAPAVWLTKDNNLLYYVSFPGSSGSLTAFDVNTKTTKWNAAIGPNSGSTPSGVRYNNETVCLTNGSSQLMVFNKTNGAPAWAQTPSPYITSVAANNRVIGRKYNEGLYAFNGADGSPAWSWPQPGMFMSAVPAQVNDELIVSATLANSDQVLQKLNATTGVTVWKKILPYVYNTLPLSEMVVAGNEIIGLRRGFGAPFESMSKVLIHDGTNGAAKDSIALDGQEFAGIGILTNSGKYLCSRTN